MMNKHEKDDQIKYKKLALNLAGLREYGFDSYGNPITIRNEKPQPTDIEVIKPAFKMSKQQVAPTLNAYYAEAFSKKPSKSSLLPPPIPQSRLNPFLSQDTIGSPHESATSSQMIKSSNPSYSQLPPQAQNGKNTKNVQKSKKPQTLLDEHMTYTQRARSQTELPDINYTTVQGCVQIQLGRTYIQERARGAGGYDRESQSSKPTPKARNGGDRESSGQKVSSQKNLGVQILVGGKQSDQGSVKEPKNQSTMQTLSQPNFTFAEESGTLKGLTSGASVATIPIQEVPLSSPKKLTSKILAKVASIQSRNSIEGINQTPEQVAKTKKFFKKNLTHIIHMKNPSNTIQSLTNQQQQFETVDSGFSKTILPTTSLSKNQSRDNFVDTQESRNKGVLNLKTLNFAQTTNFSLQKNEKKLNVKPILGRIKKTDKAEQYFASTQSSMEAGENNVNWAV
ncbi:hypothetical protein FGO68_gene7117 [Halteria grandinella]|uniref:Uncharacterized protein n=1 Tax=Halteria grandinella TaxID=5974 RepID=A0A8J8T516_HALGN|nr:hypothetical protein FGO68_gene7117 [Halteria grandinella]